MQKAVDVEHRRFFVVIDKAGRARGLSLPAIAARGIQQRGLRSLHHAHPAVVGPWDHMPHAGVILLHAAQRRAADARLIK